MKWVLLCITFFATSLASAATIPPLQPNHEEVLPATGSVYHVAELATLQPAIAAAEVFELAPAGEVLELDQVLLQREQLEVTSTGLPHASNVLLLLDRTVWNSMHHGFKLQAAEVGARRLCYSQVSSDAVNGFTGRAGCGPTSVDHVVDVAHTGRFAAGLIPPSDRASAPCGRG